MGPQNSKLALILADFDSCDSNFFLPQRYDRLVYWIHSHWDSIPVLVRLASRRVFRLWYLFRERGISSSALNVLCCRRALLGYLESHQYPSWTFLLMWGITPIMCGNHLDLEIRRLLRSGCNDTSIEQFCRRPPEFYQQISHVYQPLVPNCHNSMPS